MPSLLSLPERNLRPMTTKPLFAKEILPFIPHNINISNAKLIHNKTDWSQLLTFGTQTLRIQTPKLKVMFNIVPFKNPGIKKVRYSINLGLSKNEAGILDFKECIHQIEKVVKEKYAEPNKSWVSTIRHSYKNPSVDPTLRVKIPNEKNQLMIEWFYGDISYPYPYVKEISRFLKKDVDVDAVIELNSKWVTEHLYGISFKLVQIRQQDKLEGKIFRESATS